jgi:hypothetical protein
LSGRRPPRLGRDELVALRSNRGLAGEAVILSVVADPEPQDPALDVNAKGAMMKPDSA